MALLAIVLTLAACSNQSAQLPSPPSAAVPSPTADPRLKVAERLNAWITGWNAVAVASKDAEPLTFPKLGRLLGEIAEIGVAAAAAGAPLPDKFDSVFAAFVQTLAPPNPNDPSGAYPSLVAGQQKKQANVAMAELRKARASYPLMSEPLDFRVPNTVSRASKELVVDLSELPAGFTLAGERNCREPGGIPADCWERRFAHSQYAAIIQVMRLPLTELAQGLLEQLVTPKAGGRAMSLGGTIGDASGAWTAPPDKDVAVTFVLSSRVSNAVVWVFVGGAVGTDPARAVELLKIQVARVSTP